jgi:hypothetical protein
MSEGADTTSTGEEAGTNVSTSTADPSASSASATATPSTSGDPTTGSDGGSSGEVGSGSTGSAPDCDAGPPVDAPDDTWTWVEVEGTACAFQGTAGFAIHPTRRSANLLIALEGGGACFSPQDCQASRLDGIDSAGVLNNLVQSRLFDRTQPSNPFADYDFVFVPYCTGDFHSGDNVTDTGVRFVGHSNMQAFLDRIVPTFCGAEQVVLTGFSAGGFGSTFNYPQVHEAFGSTPVDLIDDSGPYMHPPWMPSDMQAMFDGEWGFRANMPADCTDCATRWDALYTYASERWPNDRMSLISARYDFSIQGRFAPYTPMATLDDFAMAIDALADDVFAPLPNVHVFYIEENGHVYLPSTPLDQLVVSGTSLEEFLRLQIDDDAAWTDVRP